MEPLINNIDDGLFMRESGVWTKEKLDYLSRYIDIFETAMRNKFETRFFVDLLAGPGKNRIRSSNEIIFGSPLIALNARYPFSHYIFNEIDHSSFLALKERCRNYPLYDISIFNEDCNLIAQKIIEKINSANRGSLNLCFIDPEGFEVKWTTMEILASLQRLDLLIYYPQMGLNQNLGKLYDSPSNCAIDDFFGTIEWRQIYKRLLANNQLKNVHRELIDLYKERLCGLGYVQVLSDEEIGNEPLMRNLQRHAPLYRLLFASKHELGHSFWKKITRRDVYGQGQLF